MNVAEATSYISEFIRHVQLPVYVNDALASQQPLDAQAPSPKGSWSHTDQLVTMHAGITATVTVAASADGVLWLHATDILENGCIEVHVDDEAVKEVTTDRGE